MPSSPTYLGRNGICAQAREKANQRDQVPGYLDLRLGACTDMGSFSSSWRIIIPTAHRNTGRAPCFAVFYFLIAPKRKKEKRTRSYGGGEKKRKERVKQNTKCLLTPLFGIDEMVFDLRKTHLSCPFCGVAAKPFSRTRRRKHHRPEKVSWF